MHNVDVYIDDESFPTAKIRPLKLQRDWMHSYVYNCYPIAMANTFGYGIYFEHDISFIWNGLDEGAVGIIGKENIWVGRGEGTVSFASNLIFKTDENTSMLTMPVPNEYLDGAKVLSTILSTSVFTGTFTVVWKLDTPNKEYFVPAGTNIACLLPISIASIQGSVFNIKNATSPFPKIQDSEEYMKYLKQKNSQGIRPTMYKKGIDHTGKIIGKHEVDRIDLTVRYEND
jgi:hypothetical protein